MRVRSLCTAASSAAPAPATTAAPRDQGVERGEAEAVVAIVAASGVSLPATMAGLGPRVTIRMFTPPASSSGRRRPHNGRGPSLALLLALRSATIRTADAGDTPPMTKDASQPRAALSRPPIEVRVVVPQPLLLSRDAASRARIPLRHAMQPRFSRPGARHHRFAQSRGVARRSHSCLGEPFCLRWIRSSPTAPSSRCRHRDSLGAAR